MVGEPGNMQIQADELEFGSRKALLGLLCCACVTAVAIYFWPARTVSPKLDGLGQCARICETLLVNTDLKQPEWQSPPFHLDMANLSSYFEKQGLQTKETNLAQLESLSGVPLPAIIQRRQGEYVVLAGWQEESKTVCTVQEEDRVEQVSWASVQESMVSPTALSVYTQKSSEHGRLSLPFGKIQLSNLVGTGIEHRDAILLNTGGQPLRISGHRFSCGCTTAHIDTMEIAPYSFAKMHVEIDAPEVKSRSFTLDWLATTDGLQSRRVFPVEGSIDRPVFVSPNYFGLGNISPTDASQVLDFEISNLHGNPDDFVVQPVDIEPGLKWLGVKHKQNKIIGKLRLNVWETVRDDSGFFRVAATLAIDGSRNGRHMHLVAASGRLIPWIDVSPKIVNIGKVHAGQVVSRRIHFESRASGPVRVGVAQPEYLAAKVDGQYVDVTFTAPSAPRIFQTTLLLMVGSESVSIPIAGTLASDDLVVAKGPTLD